MNNGFFRRELQGGARLVGQHVPGRRSISLGVWLRLGSRDEATGQEGIAHFIEHLVFKGSARRSAPEIASSLERVGGALEAFTTKDTTCFYARVLEEDTALAMDVLGDLISHPLLNPDDIDLERNVVLEEIKTVEDSPEELIGDLAHQYLWPDHIMGASILGTPDSLSRLSHEVVTAFHRHEYRGSRVVVAAVGAVDADSLATACEEHLDLPADPAVSRRDRPESSLSTLAIHSMDQSQLHILLATEAPSEPAPERPAVQLLTEILGGGMSSRLFQSIREEQGLAYSVQAYTEHFDDTGVFGISLAVSPDRGPEALHRTLEEMERFRNDGLRSGELEGAKAQVRGSLIMGMESLTNQMSHFARNELRGTKHETAEETLARFEAVSEEDVIEAAGWLLDPERQNLLALGPVGKAEMGYRTFSRVVEAEGI